MNAAFYLESALLGAGLAMDAFSVSLANGLREPRMGRGRMAGIAGVYAGFQYLMPLLGWVCVHTVVEAFSSLERVVPWIAFGLLLWIGGKMLFEGLRERRNADGKAPDGESSAPKRISKGELLTQGIATSIDALSVGFTIEQYNFGAANLAAGVIGAVTFGICLIGLALGKKAGLRFSRHASILGGVILIAIGLKIFLEGL